MGWRYGRILAAQFVLATVFVFGDATTVTVSFAKESLSKVHDKLNATAVQKWDYVTVRPHAHMFWWLFRTTHPDGHIRRPLIMWLQGGPGASSTGYGSFDIIGPLDRHFNRRNTSWVRESSVLFVDNPVGAGFSYVDTEDAYTTDVGQVADDLLVLLAAFLNQNPEYKVVPFYIFGQSYGGKMAAAFARRLYGAIQRGHIACALKGFAMGNSWISPIDSTMTWGPFLFQMSVVDERGYAAILEEAIKCKKAAAKKQWLKASELWRTTQLVLDSHSNYVDFYNVLKYRTATQNTRKMPAMFVDGEDEWSGYFSDAKLSLTELMNGIVKDYLRIIPRNVTWGGQKMEVFRKHQTDFMKNVINIVDELLKTTHLDIVVYQGQLDLICDTKGAMDWVQRLTWDGLDYYNNAPRTPLLTPSTGQTEAFVKAHDNFRFYWMLQAGHSVSVPPSVHARDC
ncbi:hypothetical protein NP493_1124g00036 [Ridgeia piscesae]|uniref:Retinoid-inducible serine carboxypeptidase n=1 Tax=Ridgeia piscesae TaxID=27915 RepID=A0AAD9KGK0_RIDPI|nr:hypothetical protein NP493_1124g00036 [Ridgeia piscesae]